MIISVIWYRYIGVLVSPEMLPRRGLLAPLAVPLPSVFFMELRFWSLWELHMRYRLYRLLAIIHIIQQ